MDMKKLTNILIGLIVAVAFAAGCKDKAPRDVAQAEAPAAAAPEIRLYVLDGGTVGVNKLELFAQDEAYKDQTADFADAYYIIEHPKGTLMWDAGLPESLVAMGEPFTDPSGAFTVSRPDSLHTQLERIGLSVDDIEFLALSHTHFDHIGHAENVQGATWLVQEAEYDFATSAEMQQNQPDIYNAVNDLKKIKKIKGDYDVFGDGTVVIKFMPGHTPGHCALFVNLPEHGPLLLSGDLYHLQLSRQNKRVPIFNYDVKQTLESMDRFEAFADSVGAKVYLQHSKEDFNALPKAPEYLK